MWLGWSLEPDLRLWKKDKSPLFSGNKTTILYSRPQHLHHAEETSPDPVLVRQDVYTCASTECGLVGTQIKFVCMCEHLRKKIYHRLTDTVTCTVSETYQCET